MVAIFIVWRVLCGIVGASCLVLLKSRITDGYGKLGAAIFAILLIGTALGLGGMVRFP